MTTETQYEWVREACSSWEGNDPAELLEHLMAQGECPAFGPVHHVLVGAALLACAQTVDGEIGRAHV